MAIVTGVTAGNMGGGFSDCNSVVVAGKTGAGNITVFKSGNLIPV
jgi:hypothetical protein